MILLLVWQDLLQYISLTSQGEFFNSLSELFATVVCQLPLLTSRILLHPVEDWHFKDVAEHAIRGKQHWIDQIDACVELFDGVL